MNDNKPKKNSPKSKKIDDYGSYQKVRVRATSGRNDVALFERYKNVNGTWVEYKISGKDTQTVYDVELSPLVQAKIRHGVLIRA